MTRSGAGWLVVGLACACLVGCKEDGPKNHGWKPFTPPSPSTLDGMQLDSARRVAIESAKDSMVRHDLERLKQLAKWVRGRAQVVILEPADLEALDLAIVCLGQPGPSPEIRAQVQRIAGGKLKEHTLRVCEDAPSP